MGGGDERSRSTLKAVINQFASVELLLVVPQVPQVAPAGSQVGAIAEINRL